MLDRLTKRRKQDEPHPHDWDFREPTSKRPQTRFHSRSSNELPTVPSPSIFRDVAIPYSLAHSCTAPPTFEQYPAPGHVASHLLLVECFHNFKAQIELTSTFSAASTPPIQSSLSSGQGIWSSYLPVAIKRFKLWITKIEAVIRHSAVFNRYGTGSHLQGAFTENYLPPLDVLFIWYCYLQSPSSYERLIASNGFRLLSHICFPWHVFPTAIDQNTLEYRSSLAARSLWKNLVGIPFDLKDCLEVTLESSTAAFTTDDLDILELAIAQTEQINKFYQDRWLRSPALQGTIQRAMARYAEAVLSNQPPVILQTQQIPIAGDFGVRSTHSLQLDVVAQLVLNTHRAYHGAWTVFAQRCSIRDEDRPPPPSYEASHGQSADTNGGLQTPASIGNCYCWICERIKDENEERAVSSQMIPLSYVRSLDDMGGKRPIQSESSSDSEELEPQLGLSNKQIKRIKTAIRIYRHVEMAREKELQQRRDSG